MAFYKHVEKNNNGKVEYNIDIVKGIVRLAVEEVEGVVIANRQDKKTKKMGDKIDIVINKDSIDVIVGVCIQDGYSIPSLAYNIQSSIKHSVESMSRYKVDKVDVTIEDVVF